jgi:hypothetical protein
MVKLEFFGSSGAREKAQARATASISIRGRLRQNRII